MQSLYTLYVGIHSIGYNVVTILLGKCRSDNLFVAIYKNLSNDTITLIFYQFYIYSLNYLMYILNGADSINGFMSILPGCHFATASDKRSYVVALSITKGASRSLSIEQKKS